VTTQTLTALDQQLEGADRWELKDYLVVAFARDDTALRLSRHMLDRIDVVEIGRGDGPRAERFRRQGRGVLRLQVNDARISSQHASVTRVRGRFVVEDQGSRNGTSVHGAPIDRMTLSDRDVIEVGSTYLVFRSALAAKRFGEPDVFLDELAPPLDDWRTFHTPLSAVYEDLAKIAPTELGVLVLGRTGTGKERIAEGIHALSGRSGPLVAVNCATLDPNLADSALFGHQRGAFTGAGEAREGFVRRAAGGTLFLDEVAELPAAVQSRLLRVLETKEVVPVGADRGRPVDFRLVAATHDTLVSRVDAGDFRADLYARLAQMTVELPPLGVRIEDLGLLTRSILKNETGVRFERAAAGALLAAEWPHNIRQLVNALARARTLAGGGPIQLDHLPADLRARPSRAEPVAADTALDAESEARKASLIAALEATGGNVSQTADRLGLSRNSTHRWIKKFGVDPERFRRDKG